MKKFLIIFSVILFIVLGLKIKKSYAPPFIKLAVVDWTRIVGNYNAFQKEVEKLNQKKQGLIDEIEKRNKQIETLEYEIKNSTNRSEIEQKKALISQIRLENQTIFSQLLDSLDKEKQKLFDESRNKIMEAIANVSVTEGISLVFERNQVLYVSEDYADITDLVIEELNK